MDEKKNWMFRFQIDMSIIWMLMILFGILELDFYGGGEVLLVNYVMFDEGVLVLIMHI